MQSVMTAVHIDDLGTALKLVLQELRKRPAALRRAHFPLYRDLLFFASSCIPPTQLNLSKLTSTSFTGSVYCILVHAVKLNVLPL